jgi:hypothetical protein
MDSPELRQRLNFFLFDEDGEYDLPLRRKVSADWPYKLEYQGCWAIPNDFDPNDSVDVYRAPSGLYVYATKHVIGEDTPKGRSIEEYIKSEWEVEPKRLDENKK